MDLPQNKFLASLRAGKPQIGFWCALSSPLATEVVGGAGFDWLVIDMEHTCNDLASVLSQLQALSGSCTTPIVRMPSADPVLLKRLLDIGVTSFLVPFVETAEVAASMVTGTRYPPHGTRGAYLASRGGRFGRVSDYFKSAHQEICVMVQIETVKGLDALEEIAAVDGLGAVFIGPNDLSANMGHIGDQDHPDLKTAVFDAANRLARLKVPAGCTTFGDNSYDDCIAAGFSFVTVGTDIGVLARTTDNLAAIKAQT